MWAAALNIIIGLIVMIAPALFAFDKQASDINHVIGPLILTFAIVSLWEINRNARWVNLLTGAGLIILPWILQFDVVEKVIDIVAGLAVILLTIIHRKATGTYGGGWSSLFTDKPMHIEAAEPVEE